MNAAIFHLVAIALAAYAVIGGFNRRLTGQLASVLGLAFGIVSARVFMNPVALAIIDIFPSITSAEGARFIISVLSVSLIYALVYGLFKILSGILNAAMVVFDGGMLDSLLGAFFSLGKYMLALSIVYNLIVCVDMDSPLEKYGADDDGNVVEIVMHIAPAALGCMSVSELAHSIQLREARKISLNISGSQRVITCDGCPAFRRQRPDEYNLN